MQATAHDSDVQQVASNFPQGLMIQPGMNTRQFIESIVHI